MRERFWPQQRSQAWPLFIVRPPQRRIFFSLPSTAPPPRASFCRRQSGGATSVSSSHAQAAAAAAAAGHCVTLVRSQRQQSTLPAATQPRECWAMTAPESNSERAKNYGGKRRMKAGRRSPQQPQRPQSSRKRSGTGSTSSGASSAQAARLRRTGAPPYHLLYPSKPGKTKHGQKRGSSRKG